SGERYVEEDDRGRGELVKHGEQQAEHRDEYNRQDDGQAPARVLELLVLSAPDQAYSGAALELGVDLRSCGHDHVSEIGSAYVEADDDATLARVAVDQRGRLERMQ